MELNGIEPSASSMREEKTNSGALSEVRATAVWFEMGMELALITQLPLTAPARDVRGPSVPLAGKRPGGSRVGSR